MSYPYKVGSRYILQAVTDDLAMEVDRFKNEKDRGRRDVEERKGSELHPHPDQSTPPPASDRL